MSNRPRPDMIEERRKEGAARNEKWAKLSKADKLSILDHRLGIGQGASRQRKKLGN